MLALPAIEEERARLDAPTEEAPSPTLVPPAIALPAPSTAAIWRAIIDGEEATLPELEITGTVLRDPLVPQTMRVPYSKTREPLDYDLEDIIEVLQEFDGELTWVGELNTRETTETTLVIDRSAPLERVTRAIHFAAYAAARLDRPVEAAELAEIGRARWLDEAIQLGIIRGSSLPEETKIAADEAQAAVLELERRELHLLDQGAAGAIRRLENYLGIPFGGMVKVRATADPDGTEARLKQELAFVRAKLQWIALHEVTPSTNSS